MKKYVYVFLYLEGKYMLTGYSSFPWHVHLGEFQSPSDISPKTFPPEQLPSV